MMNLQGKNIILVGGLNGLGLSMAKNLLMKRIANLYIIDSMEHQDILQNLKSEFKDTNIMFARLDLLNFEIAELQSMLQKINQKLQHIDLFINGMEILMNRDLQRTMNINMNLYLNMMLMMRDMMDKNKGGRGGMIINLLSILGLQNGLNLQQALINKQMLLSLTEALAQDIRYQQSGVQIMALMPNMNQRDMLRNKDWIRGIGLQNLTMDLNQGENNWSLDDFDESMMLEQYDMSRQDNSMRRDMLLRDDFLDDNLRHDNMRRNQRRRGQRLMMDDDLRRDDYRRDDLRRDDYRRDDLRRDELRRDDLRRDELRRDDLRRGDLRRDDSRREDSRRDDSRREDSRRDDLRREDSRRDDLRREDLRMQRRMYNQDSWMSEDLLRDQLMGMDNLKLQDDFELIEQGQRLGGGLNMEGLRMIDLLAKKMIRGIEMGQNGMLLLIGLQNSRNMQKEMQLSRL